MVRTRQHGGGVIEVNPHHVRADHTHFLQEQGSNQAQN
jgi:hypothetical protein